MDELDTLTREQLIHLVERAQAALADHIGLLAQCLINGINDRDLQHRVADLLDLPRDATREQILAQMIREIGE